MTIGIVICGDPNRRALAESLFDIYSTYEWIDCVSVYFRENPAIAFNEAARDMPVDRLIGIAGDVYVGDWELFKFVTFHLTESIVCASSPLTPRRKDIFRYPKAWEMRRDKGSISGLFVVERKLLLQYPFPEKPSFLEDSLWNIIIKDAGINILSVNVPCVHIDHHPIFRLRTFIYLVFPGRFKEESLKERFMYFARMFVWEWQEIYAAIRMESLSKKNQWKFDMQYERRSCK